jgi:hypothetical protein
VNDVEDHQFSDHERKVNNYVIEIDLIQITGKRDCVLCLTSERYLFLFSNYDVRINYDTINVH